MEKERSMFKRLSIRGVVEERELDIGSRLDFIYYFFRGTKKQGL